MKGQLFPYKDENVTRKRPYVTWALIAVTVAIFILSLTNFENIISKYGFMPSEFALLTLLTSMFLHGGFDHIIGNMWFLFLFGDNVEDKFGKAKYLAFYLVAGIAATFVHYLTNPASTIPTIGASGAISGVLGAYMILFPKVRVHVAVYYQRTTVPAYVMIGLWFFMQLIFGAMSLAGGQGSGIAFFAHVGGFVFGCAVTWLARKLGRI
ncbi:MAG: rhomboid family intramembrane serine protease [Candidatus Aenigmatarchaeota archaeon]